ncbi:MAG: GntR family transcriptional regulator [Caballeronia sp.]|nr:GntR family transcriptional regulator [Caballeronia sp.]
MGRTVSTHARGTALPKVPRGAYLYTDVARELRKRVKDQVYAPGSKLPSMAELCASFGVSAITIRNAVRELAQEGLVSGHQGLGVFVRKKGHIHRVLAGNPQRSIGEEIGRAGYTARIEELSYTQLRADAETATALGVRRGTQLYRHEKATYADDEPVALHIVTLMAGLARTLRSDLGQDFLFSVLAKHGLTIAHLNCAFGAISLSEEHTHLFNLPAGFPMLQVDYLPRGTGGAPILLGTTIARSDRFRFEMEIPQKKRA